MLKVKFGKADFLDSYITEFTGVVPKNGDFGLEIEWEGTGLVWPNEVSTYWTNKEDGSLRNGREFVTRGIQFIEHLPIIIKELQHLTKAATPIYSNRTSVHVHFNVTQLSTKNVMSILTLHYLVEKMLIHSQGVDRRGNLFCLGVAEAEGQFSALLENLRRNGSTDLFGTDGFKYSAMNLSAINNYGSIEWRFLRGIIDLREIALWTEGLVNAAKTASTYTPQDIVNFFRFHDSEEFLLKFFSEELLRKYIFTEVPLWRQMLLDNFPYAYELAKTVNKLSTKPVYLKPTCAIIEDPLIPESPF